MYFLICKFSFWQISVCIQESCKSICFSSINFPLHRLNLCIRSFLVCKEEAEEEEEFMKKYLSTLFLISQICVLGNCYFMMMTCSMFFLLNTQGVQWFLNRYISYNTWLIINVSLNLFISWCVQQVKDGLGIASRSDLDRSSVTMNIILQTYPSPLATYDEVVADKDLFMSTLMKLHSQMGTKFW